MKDILKSEQGKTSEGRLFSIIGKGVAVYLLIAYAETIVNQEWILGILLATLIAPKLFEKVLYMRAGGTSV